MRKLLLANVAALMAAIGCVLLLGGFLQLLPQGLDLPELLVEGDLPLRLRRDELRVDFPVLVLEASQRARLFHPRRLEVLMLTRQIYGETNQDKLSAMFAAMAKPSPLPLVPGLDPRQNRSKIRLRSSAGMPGPQSSIVNTPERERVSATSLPGRV